MKALADQFDVLLLDLDGTVYLGGKVIDHVADALSVAADRGAKSVFVTNNASRSPADVAESLVGMGVKAAPQDVLTSPEVAAGMLATSHPRGAKVLVVGAPFLARSIEDAGLVPVRLAADEPVAVVQGHSPDTGWRELAEACIALRSGIDWVACNTDSTLPTDRGLLPGNGAMVAALHAATGLHPRVAGKPNRPMLDDAVRRSGGRRPLVIGDRLDTDIEAGVTASLPSLLVLTGVSTAVDLLAAPAHQRPTHLAMDLRGLVEADRAVEIAASAAGAEDGSTAGGGTVGSGAGWSVRAVGDELLLEHADSLDRSAAQSTTESASDLQALALLALTAWKSGVTKVRAVDDFGQATIKRLGLAG